MIKPRVDQLEADLRRAAASRQYSQLASLAREFGEAVRAYTQTLPKGDPCGAQAARELDNLFSWALVMMQAARSDCAAELRRVTTATRYTRTHVERPSGVHLDA